MLAPFDRSELCFPIYKMGIILILMSVLYKLNEMWNESMLAHGEHSIHISLFLYFFSLVYLVLCINISEIGMHHIIANEIHVFLRVCLCQSLGTAKQTRHESLCLRLFRPNWWWEFRMQAYPRMGFPNPWEGPPSLHAVPGSHCHLFLCGRLTSLAFRCPSFM